ncbi:Integrase, catalytic region (plasmid) [Acidithiobacillus caldus ATCC 51756]|uniref:Integrase, catalytic region n=1 Tax=Acidithiobacillus caldus (strain ATCC 51756 / DSM 8584 / KU) TaxID=637389 RepID=A0A059ZYU2_ACICK|nr:Integrase, catalytic region [Acidithiobacillus caldus ATCC 51756]
MERLWRSVKYEDIYLKAYAGVPDSLLGLTEYFEHYNRAPRSTAKNLTTRHDESA